MIFHHVGLLGEVARRGAACLLAPAYRGCDQQQTDEHFDDDDVSQLII